MNGGYISYIYTIPMVFRNQQTSNRGGDTKLLYSFDGYFRGRPHRGAPVNWVSQTDDGCSRYTNFGWYIHIYVYIYSNTYIYVSNDGIYRYNHHEVSRYISYQFILTLWIFMMVVWTNLYLKGFLTVESFARNTLLVCHGSTWRIHQGAYPRWC